MEDKKMPTSIEEGPIFRDPKEYEGMSQEEKEELTKQMMGNLKAWARGVPGLGIQKPLAGS